MKETDPEIKDRARTLWLAGAAPGDIVARTGVSGTTFRRWQAAWKEEGLVPAGAPRAVNHPTAVRERARDLWASGLSLAALAKLLEVPHQTVCQWKAAWVRDHGERTARVGKHQRYDEALKQRVRADWRTGVMRRELSERHRIPRATIQKWVEEWRLEEKEPEGGEGTRRGYDDAFRAAVQAEWLASGEVQPTALKMGVPVSTVQVWSLLWRAEGLVPAERPRADATEREIGQGRVTFGPLPGAALPWREWVKNCAGENAGAPMAAHHARAWDWFEALESGVKPDALIECWPRGGGKSTTVELALARQAVKGERHFALYVSATQKAANRHVQSAAVTMERVGIKRALNKYGHSLGWRSELLRTSNGFNVLGLGLDAVVRGIKLDEFRPDIIVLDDIDELGDSVEGVKAKLDVLRHSILPSGSADVAIVFVQNAIHRRSILTGCLEGSIDLLRRRVNNGIVRAVDGLRWEQVAREGERPEYRITAGCATWEGKPLETCEAEMNDSGIVSFLRECQHDTGMGGSFFADWDEKRHVVWEEEADIRRDGVFVGGYDWGYGNPCCFLLGAVERRTGAITIIDEVYRRKLTNPEQAEEVLALLKRWNVPKERLTIWADPSMWARKTDHSGKGVADVEAFHRVGLRLVKASNTRRGGWQNVRRYLREAPRGIYPGSTARGGTATLETPSFLGQVLQSLRDVAAGKAVIDVPRPPAMLRVLKGHCANLIRTIPLQEHDPTDVEDLDTTGEDHAVDALRYLLSSHPRGLLLAAEGQPAQREPHYMLTPEEQMATHPDRYEFAPYGHPDYRPPWDRPNKKERKL